MRIKLLLLAFVFAIILLFVQIINKSEKYEVDNSLLNDKYLVNEPYKYPVNIGSEKWNSFTNVLDRREACYVPEELLASMSTPALVETVVTWPLFIDVTCFDTIEMGIDWVSEYFGGIEELKKRGDAYQCLVDFINIHCPDYLSCDSEEDFDKCKNDFELNNETDIEFISIINAQTLITYFNHINKKSNSDMRSVQTYFDILTPAGTYVPAVYGFEFYDHGTNAGLAGYVNENLHAAYPTSQFFDQNQKIHPSYNCHSYAWYSQNYTNNLYWIDGEEAEIYMYDGSYSSSYPAIGRKIVYKNSSGFPGHSGIISSITDSTYVVSKWQYYGLYIHRYNDCPYYSTSQYINYWTSNY